MKLLSTNASQSSRTLPRLIPNVLQNHNVRLWRVTRSRSMELNAVMSPFSWKHRFLTQVRIIATKFVCLILLRAALTSHTRKGLVLIWVIVKFTNNVRQWLTMQASTFSILQWNNIHLSCLTNALIELAWVQTLKQWVNVPQGVTRHLVYLQDQM